MNKSNTAGNENCRCFQLQSVVYLKQIMIQQQWAEHQCLNHAFSHDILLYKMNQACTARTIIFKDNGNEYSNGERCILLALAQGV